MVNIAKAELEQFVGHDACRITEAEQAMIGEYSM
jgi:hypothetical protein